MSQVLILRGTEESDLLDHEIMMCALWDREIVREAEIRAQGKAVYTMLVTEAVARAGRFVIAVDPSTMAQFDSLFIDESFDLPKKKKQAQNIREGLARLPHLRKAMRY